MNSKTSYVSIKPRIFFLSITISSLSRKIPLIILKQENKQENKKNLSSFNRSTSYDPPSPRV